MATYDARSIHQVGGNPTAAIAEVVSSIKESIILRHECPDKILADNGTQFRSSKFARLLAAFKIQQGFIPTYAPHCNPTERINQTLKTMIAQYVEIRRWDDYIGEFQFAYNTATHETTGYTPAYLMYGREFAAPSADGLSRTAVNSPSTRFRQLQNKIVINLARAFQRQARHYDLRHRDWKPKLREWVWKCDHHLSDKAAARNAKLAPKFIGPLEVHAVSPVIYDLCDRREKWHRHVHVKDLKLAPPSDDIVNKVADDTTNSNDEGSKNKYGEREEE